MGHNRAELISDHSLGVASLAPIAPETLGGAILMLGVITILGLRLGMGRAIALSVLGNVGQWVVLAGMLELSLTIDRPWVSLGALATLGVGSLLRLTLNQGMSVQFRWRLGLGVLLGSSPVLLVMLLWGKALPSIPVIVMVMGAGLQSGVIVLGVFTDRLKRDRGELESHLSLGATLWQATRRIRIQAVQSALRPQLVVIGVPIFVLAQVWAGVPPLRSASHLIWLWAGLLWAALGSGYGVCFLLVFTDKSGIMGSECPHP